jgi:hypothetical protein
MTEDTNALEPVKVGTEKTTTVVERPVKEMPTEDRGEAELGALLDGLGDEEHKLYVSRRNRQTRKFEFLAAWTPSEFSLEDLRERYGGGDFRAQGRKGREYMRGRSATFSIAGPYRDLDREAADDAAAAAGVLAGGALTLADLVKLLADTRNPPAAAAMGNPVEMAVSLVTALQTAMAPLQAALLDAAKRDSPDVETFLAVFTKGLELGRGAGDGYGSVVDRIMPVVDRLTAAGSSPGAPTQPAALPPGPNPPDLYPGWVTAVAPFIQQLQPMAAGGAPPDLYAAVVADQATDGQVLFLQEQLVRGDDFREDFYRYFPEAVALRPWWDSFLDHLTDALLEPEAEAVTDGT